MKKITKSDLYERKIMNKGKKRHWGFTCPSCKEKFSSKTHTEYFICEEHLTGPLDRLYLFCSTKCLFDFLESLDINVECIIKEHNRMMDKLNEIDRREVKP